jgi:hypothetical protein
MRLAVRNMLIILALTLSHVVFASETINTLVKPGRYEIFDFLPVEVARRKAEAMAREDYRQGDYRYLVWGLRRENKSYGGYLEQYYGIEDARVAYCIVTTSEQEAGETYNSTMRQLLTEKYGRDVFKEAEEMSEHTERDGSPPDQL